MIYEIYTENGTKKKRALTGNGYGLPLGTWISYEGTCPDGFIESEQTFNTTTYASLYAMLGTNKVPARFDHSVLSDYEDITISSDANNPTVMLYDGFFTFLMPMGTVGILNINEVAIFQDLKRDGSWSVSSSVTVPFNKGDNLYYSRLDATPLVSKVAYYKRHLAIKATPAYVEPDTVSDMVNTLRTQDSYSIEEVNTGKKWIDGKPIYRKVVQFVAPSQPANAVDLSSLNIDEVISQHYLIHDTNGGKDNYAQMSTTYYDTGSWMFALYNNITKQIYVTGNSSWVVGDTITGIIEYTKTTD
jgi:hypothetical protein